MYSTDEARKWHRETTLLNWSNGGEVMRYAFLHMAEFFPHALIHRAGPIAELPLDPHDDIHDFPTETRLGALPLDAYVQHPESTVDGLVIIVSGRIVYESYPRIRPFDKHMYMSVAKVFASTAVAILQDRGLLDVAALVETYLPQLAKSGWAGVPVIDVLDMASGTACLELTDGAYSSPSHLYYQYEASLGWVPATDRTLSSTREYIVTLPSARPSGEAYEYTSPNTFVLSWLVEEISGLPYAEFLTQEIWSKIGAESDALIAISRLGEPASHGGMSSTLRDVARFGLLFTPSWCAVASERVVSANYLSAIQHGGRPAIYAAGAGHRQTATLAPGDDARHNTYQWDFVMPDGDFFKGGYGGQGLYVSPGRDLVIAFFGSSDDQMRSHDLKAITRQIATSDVINTRRTIP